MFQHLSIWGSSILLKHISMFICITFLYFCCMLFFLNFYEVHNILNGPIFHGYVSDKLGLNTTDRYSIPCKCGQVYTGHTDYLLRVGWRSTSGISPLDKWRSQPWKSITLTVRTPKYCPPNPNTWTKIPKRWSKLSLIPTKCSVGHGNFSFTLRWNRERPLRRYTSLSILSTAHPRPLSQFMIPGIVISKPVSHISDILSSRRDSRLPKFW